jgi:hypothetical protein
MGSPHHKAHRGRDLPLRWLIVEWPPDQQEPIKYWISDLPTTTPEPILVRLAKLRWRIEHDYRELKDGLGLDHYEGRTWAGWHHHVTLVCAAHAFLTLQRLDPKPQRRPEPLRDATRTTSHPQPSGRRLPNLPNPFPHKETQRQTSIMTKYYWNQSCGRPTRVPGGRSNRHDRPSPRTVSAGVMANCSADWNQASTRLAPAGSWRSP